MSAAIAVAAREDVIVATEYNARGLDAMGIPMIRDVSRVRQQMGLCD